MNGLPKNKKEREGEKENILTIIFTPSFSLYFCRREFLVLSASLMMSQLDVASTVVRLRLVYVEVEKSVFQLLH